MIYTSTHFHKIHQEVNQIIQNQKVTFLVMKTQKKKKETEIN